MSWWVPLGFVRGRAARHREKRILVDARVAGLVKCEDLDIVVGVFLNDALSIIVGIEGVHENERNVDFIGLIQMLTTVRIKISLIGVVRTSI